MNDQRMFKVHETAIVDDGATIGAGTRIWHFCHVSPKARIGAGCVFGQNCFVADHVVVGDGVHVQNNVSLYEGVHLEDDVFVGPSVVFTNVKHPRGFVSRKDCYDPTMVKRGASIGANATVVCGVTLHEYCFVAAGAVVSKDVPAHALVSGVPARISGWVCRCGEVLSFDGAGNASCHRCSASYRKSGTGVAFVE